MMIEKPTKTPIEDAQRELLALAGPLDAETVALEDAQGRVLAEQVLSPEAVPSFDRSPFDGYALRSADVQNATREAPVTLSITEEIPAGSVPTRPVESGQAAKILTGSPIPQGADTVVKYEDTDFTDEAVTLFAPSKAGKNIIRVGEDVTPGEKLAEAGQVITAAHLGALASLGITRLRVVRRPRVAMISTGDELVNFHEKPGPGKIRDSSCLALAGAARAAGADITYMNHVGDSAQDLADMLAGALPDVDVIFTTGGVSVGDYDVTRYAIDRLGARPLFWKLSMRPGGAVLASEKDGKVILSLSGNPTAASLAMQLVGLPVIRGLAGRRDPLPEKITVTLREPVKSGIPVRRVVRGRLCIEDGVACLRTTGLQNANVFSSMLGCDLIGDIPQGTPDLEPGARIEAFWLRREDR